MKAIKKMLCVALLVSIFSSSIAFGRQEGMSAIRSSSKELVWVYYIGEDDSRGEAICLKNAWKQVWGDWYYFGEDGLSKQSTWVEINGKWYYFDNFSRMLHDTTTPDGYYVGPDGAWVDNHSTQGAASQTETQPAQTNTGIVYWTPSGKSYHNTSTCTTLKRSKTILSGSITDSGKSDPCNVCY